MLKKLRKKIDQLNRNLDKKRFLDTGNLTYINKLFHIDGWSKASRLFFYLFLVGAILSILTIFVIPTFWILMWVYAIIFILLLGYIFTKPGRKLKYNFTLVITIFIILIFIPTNYSQMLLYLTDDPNGGSTPEPYNPYITINNGAERTNSKIISLSLSCVYAEEVMISQYEDFKQATWQNYQNNIEYNYWLPLGTETPVILRVYAKFRNEEGESKVVYDRITYDPTWVPEGERPPANPSISIIDISYQKTSLELKLSCEYAKQMRFFVHQAVKEVDISIITDWESWEEYTETTTVSVPADTQKNDYITIYAQFKNENGISNKVKDRIQWKEELTGLNDTMEEITSNPYTGLENLEKAIRNFNHLLNWIVFIAIATLAGSSISDALTLQFGEIAKKGATIIAAIGIMTLIYSIFGYVGIDLVTPFETIGSAWNDLTNKWMGGQLSQAETPSDYSPIGDIVNLGYANIPIFFTIISGILALYYRNKDLESQLFAKELLKENKIEVNPTKFSPAILFFVLILIVYVAGYFLTTAEPTVTINPLITMMFYIGALIVLILIGWRIPILTNKYQDTYDFLQQFVRWTIFGLLGLFAWFQVLQPVFYEMNLLDTETSLLIISQDAGIFQNDILTQTFLVATPETLIFQIAFIGIGNRIYFYLKTERLTEEEIEKLNQQRKELALKFRAIEIKTGSLSRKNLTNLIKLVALRQKYFNLMQQIEEKRTYRLPRSYFIASSIIFGAIGSFFFSWYHAFRRIEGNWLLELWRWWRNPMYGLTYFGAGLFLCLIAIFCFPAAILVHALNNILAIIMSGG